MNRVNNNTTSQVLTKFVVENKFLTVLSLRGMQISAECLVEVLERFREGYQQNKD